MIVFLVSYNLHIAFKRVKIIYSYVFVVEFLSFLKLDLKFEKKTKFNVLITIYFNF